MSGLIGRLFREFSVTIAMTIFVSAYEEPVPTEPLTAHARPMRGSPEASERRHLEALWLELQDAAHVALVDTQPPFRNNRCPPRRRPDLIIDHHPRREDTQAEFADLRAAGYRG